MSTSNRIKNRAKYISQAANQQFISSSSQSMQKTQTKIFHKYDIKKHTQNKQKQYQAYYSLSQFNPQGIDYTSTLFPHSADMISHFTLPNGFVFSPLLALDNQQSGDKIPRCNECQAYMNCYNKIQKNFYTCFFCNNQNKIPKDYNTKDPSNLQLSTTIYNAISPTKLYEKQPVQQTFAFMIDISFQAGRSKMLFYAISAMKEVLSRPQLDNLRIYFFTFDQVVQEYDFSGYDVRCVIKDQSIEEQIQNKRQSSYLKDIREKLFQLLNVLQQISQKNYRRGSNFQKCFSQIFNAVKHTSPKFFVLQSNQLISSEQLFKEEVNKKTNNQKNLQEKKLQNLFVANNKYFYQTYASPIVENNCSFSYFTFQKNYKNLKIINQVLKFTSSQLKVYSKESTIELQKFYYDFVSILGATYFKDVRTEFIINKGWHFTNVYGNYYRKKQEVNFFMSWIEQNRKLVVLVAPDAERTVSFCAIQIITNYQYKRQNFMSVATVIQPVTGYMERLYKSIDPVATSVVLGKGFLQSLSYNEIVVSRNKLLYFASSIYLNALAAHKNTQNIPNSIISIVMFCLGLLKSIHSQPQNIQYKPIFDKMLAQRNLLKFCPIQEFYNVFSPYLFDLANMDGSMCCQDSQFIYPNIIQPQFNNIHMGLYLLDAGTALYLFIAKQCEPNLLSDIFGKQKLQKNDQLTQQILINQTSFRARQIQTLIKYLRQQKSYGWIPLYIVKCGENTINQRNFYLFFYRQKYQQYQNFNINLSQFISLISQFK